MLGKAVGEPYDVIVVGAGPTGLTVAVLLAHRGLKVALYEKHSDSYRFPRAGHIDHEALRIIQQVGALQPVLDDAVPWVANRWLNASGEVLFEFRHWNESASGFQSSGFFQPILEESICNVLNRLSEFVTIYRGCSAESFVQDEEFVNVSGRRISDGEEVSATGRYMLAADGADSTIRQQLGIQRSDYGFNETWCCVDVAYKRGCDYGPPTIIGDPHRPRYFGPLGKRHHRFEWKVGADELNLDHRDPERAWSVLASYGVSNRDVEIIRQVTYEFEYRLAGAGAIDEYFYLAMRRIRRLPALGQGMCNGMRDAANLAWKLALVCRHRASATLLDTFQTERYPHVKAWSDMSLVASQIAFTNDESVAAARDKAVRQGKKLDFGPRPELGAGVFDTAEDYSSSLRGKVFPQREIIAGNCQGRFDDFVADGFLVVCKSRMIPELSVKARSECQRLHIKIVTLGVGADLQCTDEVYDRFFLAHNAAAILVRPDKYIFGAVSDLGKADSLITRLGFAIEK